MKNENSFTDLERASIFVSVLGVIACIVMVLVIEKQAHTLHQTRLELKLEQCIGWDISDYHCDSCYRAVYGREPK